MTARVPLGSPVPRAVAVVVRGAKLLVVARRLDGREYAVLPGGGIEPGETPEQAVVREAREETGLETRVVRWLFDDVYLLHIVGGDVLLGHDPEPAHLP